MVAHEMVDWRNGIAAASKAVHLTRCAGSNPASTARRNASVVRVPTQRVIPGTWGLKGSGMEGIAFGMLSGLENRGSERAREFDSLIFRP